MKLLSCLWIHFKLENALETIQGGELHTHLQQGLSGLPCLGRETHKCVVLWFGSVTEQSHFMRGSLPCTASCGALHVMSNGSKHLIVQNFLLRLLWAKPDDTFAPSVFRSCVYRASQQCCLGLGPLVSCFVFGAQIFQEGMLAQVESQLRGFSAQLSH